MDEQKTKINENKILDYKQVGYVIGIIAGIIIIILGIIISTTEIRTQHIEQAFFGADYYTESHAAMAASANNVSDLVDVAQKGFSFLLYAIGLFDICYFVSNLMGILPLIFRQGKDNGFNTNIEIDNVVEVKNDEEQQYEKKV